MAESRRRMLVVSSGIVGVFLARPLLSFGMQTPKPVPSPNAPDQNFPPGLNGPDIRPDSNTRTITPQNQREIRDDVQKLFDLVTEFKDQVEKTDLNSTISLAVVKKAQQIEKLAKHVKDLAKG